MLDEIDGAFGALVWGTLRSVNAWVDTPLEERSGMFPEGGARRRVAEVLEASVPTAIEGAFLELAHLLEQPTDADPASVGVACTRIARWAEDRLFLRTAAQFFQVAANACLSNAEYALSAARAARDLADYSRAEVWLQRAIGLSRQEGDWNAYTRSYLAYATMMRRRGNIPSARRHLHRALRRAARGGYDQLRAGAYHDLFVIEAQSGNSAVAEEHAQQAARLYPVGDPRIRQLAQDMAYLWIQRKRPREALAVFDAVLHTANEGSHPFVLGGVALASAMANETIRYRAARERLERWSAAPGVAEAWVEVAEGAMMLGLKDDAVAAATRARTIASARKEHRIEFLVDDLLAKIDAERTAGKEADGAAEMWDEGPLEAFATELVTALHPA